MVFHQQNSTSLSRRGMNCALFVWLFPAFGAGMGLSLEMADPLREPSVVKERTIVVDDVIVKSTTDGLFHKTKTGLYETVAQTTRVIFKDFERRDDGNIETIVESIVRSFAPPPLNDEGHLKSSDRSPSGILIVIRQRSSNRGLELSFRAEDAATLKIEPEVKSLIRMTNKILGRLGRRERLPSESELNK